MDSPKEIPSDFFLVFSYDSSRNCLRNLSGNVSQDSFFESSRDSLIGVPLGSLSRFFQRFSGILLGISLGVPSLILLGIALGIAPGIPFGILSGISLEVHLGDFSSRFFQRFPPPFLH